MWRIFKRMTWCWDPSASPRCQKDFGSANNEVSGTPWRLNYPRGSAPMLAMGAHFSYVVTVVVFWCFLLENHSSWWCFCRFETLILKQWFASLSKLKEYERIRSGEVYTTYRKTSPWCFGSSKCMKLQSNFRASWDYLAATLATPLLCSWGTPSKSANQRYHAS